MTHHVKKVNTGNNEFYCDTQHGTKLNPANLHEYYLNCETEYVKHADSATFVSREDDVFTVRVLESGVNKLSTLGYNRKLNVFHSYEYDPCVVLPALLVNEKNKHYFSAAGHPSPAKSFATLDGETSAIYADMCEQKRVQREQQELELQLARQAQQRVQVVVPQGPVELESADTAEPTEPQDPAEQTQAKKKTVKKVVKKTSTETSNTRGNNLED